MFRTAALVRRVSSSPRFAPSSSRTRWRSRPHSPRSRFPPSPRTWSCRSRPRGRSMRAVAQKLTEAWGQGVVVENKPGAGGNIGADYVAKSAPDGYTVVMGALSTHAVNPRLYAKMPYDAQKDFA